MCKSAVNVEGKGTGIVGTHKESRGRAQMVRGKGEGDVHRWGGGKGGGDVHR